MCLVAADLGTALAEDAPVFVEEELGCCFLGLGIVAPFTPKGAALQEDGSADARTVVHAKALYLGHS